MRHKLGTALIAVGAVLLIAALSLWAYNKWDDWRAGQSVASIEDMLKTEESETSGKSYDGTLPEKDIPENGIMPTIEIDGYDYIGTLSVSRFGLELPVMSEWSYPGLKIAPGRYAGSVWTDDLVICGHNYERHFGNLKNLEAGDTIQFTDVTGNVFTYEVQEIEILQPTSVEAMLNDYWDLTLFTCTLGGQARVTVRCMRLE